MRSNRSEMFLGKTTSLCLLLVILLCFLASPVLVAADNGGFQHSQPPLRDGSSHKAFTWGNDVTVATGTVEGGDILSQ